MTKNSLISKDDIWDKKPKMCQKHIQTSFRGQKSLNMKKKKKLYEKMTFYTKIYKKKHWMFQNIYSHFLFHKISCTNQYAMGSRPT